MLFLRPFTLITRFLPKQINSTGDTIFSSVKVLHKNFYNMNNISVSIENGILNGSSEKNWFQYEEIGNKNVIVMCGPSGSGKSTLLKFLMREYQDCFGFSISHTTRKPREGEIPGKDYYFVNREDVLKAINNDEFLEYTEFSGNIYGTSKKAVKNVIQKGRICILDIEIEGVKSIKNIDDFDAKYVFIKPPSIQVLEERLRGRGTESEESIQKRLARAKVELAYGETPGNFDLVLVNDDANETYQELKKFLKKDIDDIRKKRNQK